MRKHSFGLVSVLLLLLLSLAGCSADDSQQQSSEEISYEIISDDMGNSIESTAASYLAAVASHDHQKVTMFTTSDFVMNYNETGFYDYCSSVTDFSITELDLFHVTENDGVYYVPVSYVLTYGSDHVDEYGQSQAPGEYTSNVTMAMTEQEDSMKICGITERAMG